MRVIHTSLLSLVMAITMSACSFMAPQYTTSMENIQTLKDSGIGPVKVGTFNAVRDYGNPNAISLRGSSLNSPYGNSYEKYLEAALKQELSFVNRLSTTADTEVSGSLLKNDLNTSSFVTGTGDISARFIVKKSDKVLYDQIKSAHTEFPSSFVGSIAIPRAIQEYPNLVQKLLTSLYTDPAFLDALK